MRLSQLFGKTLREAPADAAIVARQLAMRAALIRPTPNGDVYLPLGWRARERLERIIQAELDTLGGQEFHAPASDPDSLVAELSRRDINSYRDLPVVLYNFDEVARGYALQADTHALHSACVQIFENCDLKVLAVEAEGGVEFFLPHPKGQDTFMQCDACGYAATPVAAEFHIDPCDSYDETISPLEKVATPNCNTIAALALFLNLPKCQTLKAVMYTYDESEFVFVAVRGDLDVSEHKVRRLLGSKALRPATEAEIVAAGAAPGYASPRGLRLAPNLRSRAPALVTVVADESVYTGSNYAAGANEAGYHFINVNYPRDFSATVVADVALPVDGLKCGECGKGLLRDTPGLRLGDCRQSETASTALDSSGRPQPLALEVCEIDMGQLLTAIIESHHDDDGIVWPASLAPFDTHLIKLGKAPETATAADGLYAELLMKGEKVLYDDRDESAGVKFADADLIGLPTRITVSDKSLKAGGVEVKRRASAEKEIVPLEAIRK